MGQNTILVVMPVYNAEETLEAAIQSVLGQQHKDLLLAIVDDASTDNSLEIAKTFLSDSRVTLFQNKINMGAYYSRNYGLHAFKDDSWTFFTTHDADDVSFSDRYKTIVRKFKSASKYNGIQDTFDRINLLTGQTLSSKMTMAHAVFTREVFDQLGYFDNVRFGGDWEHWQRLKLFNHTFDTKKQTFGIKKILGESYIHDKNLTVLIPETSIRRHQYIKRAGNKMKRMRTPSHFYFNYEPEKGYTRRVS